MTRLTISLALVGALGMFAAACDSGGACTIVEKEDGKWMTCPDGSEALVQPVVDNSVTTQVAADACTVADQGDGSYLLDCGDTQVTLYDGAAGNTGLDGDGCTVTANDDGTYLLACGENEVTLSNGAQGEQGLQGEQGEAGVDGQSCTIEQVDGEAKLVCDDGTEWTLSGDDDPIGTPDPDPTCEDDDPDCEPVGPVELTLMGTLTPDELAQIDVLRDAIEQGLTLGGDSYLDTVSLSLQQQGVVNNYEAGFNDDYSLTQEPVDSCPFVKNMANTVPTQFACDALVDIAKQAVNGDIVALLDSNPLPQEIADADDSGSAGFWYEQGAISGIEQHTVLVRSDLKTSLVCNVDETGEANPTAAESSYEKGLVVGAQAMADAFNDWLADQGHTADYPTMSNPITVCNINQGALDPARQNAKGGVPETLNDNPLCPDYEPPNTATEAMFTTALVQYEAGVQAGIEAEYALAAVRIFKVVPCNVGDPLVVDLDGDGIELRPIHRGVNFDFYGVGQKQATAWISSDDALLAMDRDHDGAITTGLELFGNVDQAFSDGFTHLSQLDQNADGVIDSNDPGYAELVLWRDNGDGVSQAAELLSLTEVGLTAIPLNPGGVSMRSEGTRIPMAVQAGTFLVGDALFTTAPYASPRF